MERTRLIFALNLMATIGPDAEEQVRALREQGFGESEAHRLAIFAPSALVRLLLDKFGVSVSDTFSFRFDDGSFVEGSFAAQPEYREVLAFAYDHFDRGVLTKETFGRLVDGTPEVNVLSNAPNEGAEIQGSVLAVAYLYAPCVQHLCR